MFISCGHRWMPFWGYLFIQKRSKDLLACHAVFDEAGLYFGAYICLLLCLQFSKTLKDLLIKLGTITGGWLLYNSSTNRSLNCSYFILADGTLIKLSNILNILFKLMFVIYY